MRLTEQGVEKLFTKLGAGEFHSAYGPSRYGGARIWEVWVLEEDEYHTRFLLEDEGREPLYFDTFTALMDHLNDLYRDAVSESGAIDWTRTKELAELQRKKLPFTSLRSPSSLPLARHSIRA